MDTSLKETALLLPKEMVRKCMISGEDLVGLMRMSVTVIQPAYNEFGLLYLVEGRNCDIEALFELGFMEWI